MTAPVETPPVAEQQAAPPPVATPTPPSPADMPSNKPPAAAAPTTEAPAEDGADEAAISAAEAKLRKENATWRTKLRDEQAARAEDAKAVEALNAKLAEQDERWAKLNAVFNPDANTPPDPAKLAEQVAAKEAENAQIRADFERKFRDLTIKAALPAAIAKAKADPELTGDALTARGILAKLDPTSDTFTADLESAVAALVEATPRLKADVPAAQSRRSGAEIPGRSGGDSQLTQEDVARLKQTPGALTKALKEGRLRNLGAGQ